MKKLICVALAVLVCACAALAGCTPSYGKSPAEYKKIRWSAPDYSFIINPADDCKGSYTFDGKKYKIRAEFDHDMMTAYDTEKNDAELFNAQWKYEDDEKLFIYGIIFNTADYKEFKDNYSEFVRLNQEKLK